MEASAAAEQGAGVDEAILTPAQQVIRRVLHVDAQRSPMDAFKALIKLESRAMPRNIASKQLDPRHNPQLSCFDTASRPPAWTSHKVCQRCRLVAELLQDCTQGNAASALLTGLVGTAVFVTACASDVPWDTEARPAPSLPRELVDMIIDCCMADVWSEDERPGALMHVSSAIRYRVVRTFGLVKLQQRYSDDSTSSYNTLPIPMQLLRFMWDTSTRHFSSDFTLRRYGNGAHEVALPDCDDVLLIDGRETCQELHCTVKIEEQESYYGRGSMEGKTATKVFKPSPPANAPETPGCITVRDVCTTLREVFQDDKLKGYPTCADSFRRARYCQIDTPCMAMGVKITLRVEHAKTTDSARYTATRVWKFCKGWTHARK